MLNVRRYVTLRGPHAREEIELEMPGDVEIRELMPDILKALGWPEVGSAGSLIYRLFSESGEGLDDSQTLEGLGVQNSDVISIRPGDEPESPEHLGQEVTVEKHAEEGSARQLPQRSAGQPMGSQSPGLTAPPYESTIIDEPCLVSSKGIVFVIGQGPAMIGRPGKGSKPAVDLTELDAGIVSSRNHAEIRLDGGEYILHVRETTNGTLVNGVDLEAGDSRVLRHGDRIQFGFKGVELTFQVPGKAG